MPDITAGEPATDTETAGDHGDLQRICAFLTREAWLLDDQAYDEWEALWTDDALYWVPAGDEHADPERKVSIVYDNRGRIRTRLIQLQSGDRHAQTPPSRTQHLLSNTEVVERDGTDVVVRSGFLVVESRLDEVRHWAGKVIHRLRDGDAGFRLVTKKVVLVNLDAPLPALAFLL